MPSESSPRIVVLGGGIAGLAVAIALDQRGLPVTLIERDPPPPEGQDPFLAWKRRGVPQFRLPHGFSARTRNLLAERAPAVLERLRADGIEEINLFKRLVPEDMWKPGDEEFANLWARRSTIELALRLTAQAQARIHFRCPATASGLLFERAEGRPPRVTGVKLADGGEVPADVVLDCSGQRSAVGRWMAAENVDLRTDVQDCETVYFSRYFRFTPSTAMSKTAIATLRGELGTVAYIGFPGDHDTFAISFEAHPSDEALRELRNAWAWDAVAARVPAVAPWVDPANATPLGGVQIMGAHHNVRRRYVTAGKPAVLGMLPVGDALCTTNPAYGWGSAMALTYAFTAADVVVEHLADLHGPGLVLDYDAAVAAEADAVYRESAAMDRARIYRITGVPVPEEDRAEMARQQMIAESIAGGVMLDVELGRAFCRRVNLVGPADEVLDNPELARRSAQTRERLAAEAEPGPDMADLHAVLAEARPSATV